MHACSRIRYLIHYSTAAKLDDDVKLHVTRKIKENSHGWMDVYTVYYREHSAYTASKQTIGQDAGSIRVR
jgi:hypothetical protein